jgi:hypothetical protein
MERITTRLSSSRCAPSDILVFSTSSIVSSKCTSFKLRPHTFRLLKYNVHDDSQALLRCRYTVNLLQRDENSELSYKDTSQITRNNSGGFFRYFYKFWFSFISLVFSGISRQSGFYLLPCVFTVFYLFYPLPYDSGTT